MVVSSVMYGEHVMASDLMDEINERIYISPFFLFLFLTSALSYSIPSPERFVFTSSCEAPFYCSTPLRVYFEYVSNTVVTRL